MELDTGTRDKFLTESTRKEPGSPALEGSDIQYESAARHAIDTLWTCRMKAQHGDEEMQLEFVITQIPNLNLLGRTGIKELGILLDMRIGFGEQGWGRSTIQPLTHLLLRLVNNSARSPQTFSNLSWDASSILSWKWNSRIRHNLYFANQDQYHLPFKKT